MRDESKKTREMRYKILLRIKVGWEHSALTV